jgi:hypothetical protein
MYIINGQICDIPDMKLIKLCGSKSPAYLLFSILDRF